MRAKQRGFSLIELLIVVAVILVIAAIAIPNLLRSRMAANEASAVASLRSINTSEVVYQSTYGSSFADTLAALSDGGSPANCVSPNSPSSTSSCLIDAALASGNKSGYQFTYSPVSSGAAVTAYSANADPVSASAGARHFYTDQTNVIRVNATAAASNTDPSI
jgi:prepilin-type N-terminal cleavage/methylation domain-containing protein